MRARRVLVHGRARGIDERRERRAGRALLPRELRGADRACEPRVPEWPFREHEQMLARRIGDAVGRPAVRAERHLRTEHGRQADGAGGLGESDHAVEAVVVGARERAQPEPGRFLHQFLGVAGTVEERKVGVAVQLRVHAPPPGPLRLAGLTTIANIRSYCPWHARGADQGLRRVRRAEETTRLDGVTYKEAS